MYDTEWNRLTTFNYRVLWVEIFSDLVEDLRVFRRHEGVDTQDLLDLPRLVEAEEIQALHVVAQACVLVRNRLVYPVPLGKVAQYLIPIERSLNPRPLCHTQLSWAW